MRINPRNECREDVGDVAWAPVVLLAAAGGGVRGEGEVGFVMLVPGGVAELAGRAMWFGRSLGGMIGT